MGNRTVIVSCTNEICGCFVVLTAMPLLHLFADDPLCNGYKIGTGLHECLPLDMSSCAGRTQLQCRTRPCGDPDMIKYIESVADISQCVWAPESWVSKKGWSVGCYDLLDQLICYKVYACMWDPEQQKCVPFKSILCENIVLPSYPAQLPCRVGASSLATREQHKPHIAQLRITQL